jgi:hypothetical protein
MMHSTRIWPRIWAFLLVSLIATGALAQGNSANAPGRQFGIGQPQSVADLPPGPLRSGLERLPKQARGKALGWLQRISFPAEDVANLRTDPHGAIYYEDTFVPATAIPSEAASAAGSPVVDPEKVFKLHSRPGSSNVVFLDFDGQVLEDNVWNYYLDPVLVALPFDPSNNDNPPTVANFTQDELSRIAEIWHRVAADFAAFDIDVTTEEPSEFTSTTGTILFTHDSDAEGRKMPSQNAGGVAYLDVFGWSNYGTYYSPALVYYTNLASWNQGDPTMVAEAASHEFGHHLGLSHDGLEGGSTYYQGHGSGLVDWAPIMGSAYGRNVTQWSQGEYSGANNLQDDLAIIAEDLTYLADDHGDTAAEATALVVDADGSIVASSPELDPDNVLSENKGVIGDRDDVDWFYVDVATSGTLEISATPSWHSFTRNDYRGENLDIAMSLLDADLKPIAEDEPDNNTDAMVTASVTPGRYYVEVQGVGNSTLSDYSDYSSAGMYFIEGQAPAGDPPVDGTPPTPAQMAWQSAPQATGPSTISMTAITAADESGTVEYNFNCVAGGAGCVSSGWQSSPSYAATGLQADTYYAYNVTARDAAGNMNGSSATEGATTHPIEDPPENQPPSAVAVYTPDPALITKGKMVQVEFDGTGSTDPDGVIAAWSWHDASGSVVSTEAVFSANLRAGTYSYTLTVTDDAGASAATEVNLLVSRPDSDGGGKGKKRKG